MTNRPPLASTYLEVGVQYGHLPPPTGGISFSGFRLSPLSLVHTEVSGRRRGCGSRFERVSEAQERGREAGADPKTGSSPRSEGRLGFGDFLAAGEKGRGGGRTGASARAHPLSRTAADYLDFAVCRPLASLGPSLILRLGYCDFGV